MNRKFDLAAFMNLPTDIKPSDYVDLLLFLGRSKPVVRLGVNSIEVYDKMEKWCMQHNYCWYISNSKFMYISRSQVLSRITSYIDDLTLPHALLLGILLGYPVCCSIQISRIGENNIDKWEMEKFDDQATMQEYKIIDPKLYRCGCSLIAHVPCCNTCKNSMRVAKKTLNIVKANYSSGCFEPWKRWIE